MLLPLTTLRQNSYTSTEKPQTPQCPVTLPNGTIIHPSPVVRWLGVFFDRKLSFKAHVDKKITSATRALQMTSRLKTSEWGLSSQHLRQLYTSCVLPILDFGAEAWWRGQKGYIDKMQRLQNTASRRILGAFRTSPAIPMEIEASLPPPAIRLQQACRKYAIRSMTLPEHHPIRLRSSTTFPPEFPTGIDGGLHQSDWDTTDTKHSQLWRIHHTTADLIPSSTRLEQLDHSANPPWWTPLNPSRVQVNITQQKKEEASKAHTSLINTLLNDPQHLLLYTDGSQTKGSFCGTGMVSIHAQHPHSEAMWSLGKHVEVYDAELFGILQATDHARQWIEQNRDIKTIWIFVDNQAAIHRCLKPHPTAGQHLSLQIIDNIQTILTTRPDTQVRIQWVPGHTAVHGNDRADACAKRATQLPPRPGVPFMSLAFLKQQVQQAGQREWQHVWRTCTTGSSYTTIAKRQPLWGPTWKPTKLISTKQTTASTIHQLRLGHGYFKSYLVRLPNNNSTRCQCSEPRQTVKHLLLGCPHYSRERERAGIQRDQTVQSLLFTQKGTDILTTYIQETGVATSQWLLQGGSENQAEDCWGWGSLGEERDRDGEELE